MLPDVHRQVAFLSGTSVKRRPHVVAVETLSRPELYAPAPAEIVYYPLDPAYAAEREAFARIYYCMSKRIDEKASPEIINATIQGLGTLPNVHLLEPPNVTEEYAKRCGEHIFGDIYDEPWAQAGFIGDHAPDLWQGRGVGLQFLLAQGFMPTREPFTGCIVAYAHATRVGGIELEHFGIVTDEPGMVYTKLGCGPRALHHEDVVSSLWGTHRFYLAKISRSAQYFSRASTLYRSAYI